MGKFKIVIHVIAIIWIAFVTANILEVTNDTLNFSNSPLISHAYAGECQPDCTDCWEYKDCHKNAEGNYCGPIQSGETMIACFECTGEGEENPCTAPGVE